MSSSTSLSHPPRNSTMSPSAVDPGEAWGLSEPGHLGPREQGLSTL